MCSRWPSNVDRSARRGANLAQDSASVRELVIHSGASGWSPVTSLMVVANEPWQKVG